MPDRRHLLAALVVLAGIAGSSPVVGEPLFTLADDGGTFLYRARPGDHPAAVAEMFGIPAREVPAFLAANGITDATRVGAGFVYRIPNPPVRELAARRTALEDENRRLARTLAEEKERTKALVHEADESRSAAADAEEHAARLVHLERWWPWVQAALVVLVLAAGGTIYTAVAAIRRQAQTELYARTLARDLEEKRKTGLAERQESARRILDLESRLRAAEAQLGPRVVISGRGNG